MWLPLRRQSIASTRRHDHVRPRMLLPAMPPRMRLTLVQVYLYIACMIYFCEVELAFSSPSRFVFHTRLLCLYHVCLLSLHMCVCMCGYIHTKFTESTCMCMYTHRHVCLHACMTMCMCACLHAHTLVYVVRVCAYIYAGRVHM